MFSPITVNAPPLLSVQMILAKKVYNEELNCLTQYNKNRINQNVLPNYRIFQFENFLRTRKRVFADNNVASPDDEEAIVGMYVTIHIKDVPRHLFNTWKEKNDRLTSEQQVDYLLFFSIDDCYNLLVNTV